MHYRPDIDGLRAVAILPVVFFHAGVVGFSGGYVGVDVFFVISGFVIASLIRRELDEGSFSFWGFYERRIRRLYPALFATLAFSFVLAAVLMVPPHFDAFSKSALAAVAFVSNVWFWKNSGYFEADVNLVPLLHTWSLAVEEQFYLLAPIAFYIIYRWLGRRWALLLAPAIVVSFALSVYATGKAPSANFFLLPTRAWELLLGAFLALVPLRFAEGRPVREAGGLIGLALIALAVFTYTEDTPFPGMAALLPCLGAALIIHARGDTLVGRLLSVRPLVGIGLISYSLYLVHWPVIVFHRYATMRDPVALEIAAFVAVSVVLAVLSWRYVEQPFRRPAPGVPRRRAFVAAGVAMAATAAVAATGILTKGLPIRTPGFAAEEIAMHDGWRAGTCFLLPENQLEDWNVEDCFRTTGRGREALLWGDSYAAHWTPGLEQIGAQIPYDVIQYTSASCPPILAFRMNTRPLCTPFNQNALTLIEERGIKTVILSAYWKAVRQRGLDRLPETIATLKGLGVEEIIVIGQSPIFATDVQSLAFRAGFTRDDNAAAWTQIVDPELSEAIRGYADGTRYVDPIPLMCPDGTCPIKLDGRFLFSDNGHHTVVGSARAAALTFPFVAPDGAVASTDLGLRPTTN